MGPAFLSNFSHIFCSSSLPLPLSLSHRFASCKWCKYDFIYLYTLIVIVVWIYISVAICTCTLWLFQLNVHFEHRFIFCVCVCVHVMIISFSAHATNMHVNKYILRKMLFYKEMIYRSIYICSVLHGFLQTLTLSAFYASMIFIYTIIDMSVLQNSSILWTSN